jgi:hypothetical protein
MRLLLLVAVLAAASPAAAAEVRPERVTRAVGIASGVPSPDVSCESNNAAWEAEVVSVGALRGSDVGGYTIGGVVRLAPWVCRSLQPASPRFAEAIYVLGVEAARLAGHRGRGSEAMAGCWGLLWSADIARRVWGIRFFTPASDRVIRQALEFHRTSLAAYQSICR